MGTVAYLNGDETVVACANCDTLLGNERAISHTNAGVKYFCKLEDENDPQASCYNQWARKNPRLIRRFH